MFLDCYSKNIMLHLINKDMKGNNFCIGDINGRYNAILKKSDYGTLKTCKSLEEIIVKLNHHFSFINEEMEYEELRTKFVKNVMSELNEFNMKELEFFIEYYKIVNFFNKMEGIRENSIGQFTELKSIDLCKSFDDVQKLCITNCFLKKYFTDINSYDKQVTMLKVMKNYMDCVYANSTGFLREILEHEGDRQILEICLNGKKLENKRLYFPNATTLNGQQIEQLMNTSDVDEIKIIFNINDVDPIEATVRRISAIYSHSFCQYDDNSCVYAYFKLKEQEIENIMWIIECILQDMPERMDDIIVYE